MRLKWIGTWDGHKARLARLMWDHDMRFLSFGLSRSLFYFRYKRGDDEWRATLLGVSIHYRRSVGGQFV